MGEFIKSLRGFSKMSNFRLQNRQDKFDQARKRINYEYENY